MDLAIVGAGEFAREIYDMIHGCSLKDNWNRVYFVDTESDKKNNIVQEKKFFEEHSSDTEVIIALGEPLMRDKLRKLYQDKGFKFASVIHPNSVIASNVKISDGVIIFPFVFISSNVKIGENTVIHANAVIENDCKIGADCVINWQSGIGANTFIGQGSFVGPNSVVRDGLDIGDHVIIGMGSVVVKNVKSRTVYVGNPARKIKENSKGIGFAKPRMDRC
ncbi:MAG: acetyltransferase [Selenomonadales bacterium]|nr:acetyltransferase [Selenomonadales bacterium]